MIYQTPSASALSDFSWSSGNITTELRNDLSPPENKPNGCSVQKVYIGNLSVSTDDICVYRADGFRYGILDKRIGQYGRLVNFVIGYPDDSRMYTVKGMPTSGIIWSPGSKDIVYRVRDGKTVYGYSINIIRDIRSALTGTINDDLSYGYGLIGGVSEVLINDEHGEPSPTVASGVSNNGRWLAAEMYPVGVVLINLDTREKSWLTQYHMLYGRGMDAIMEIAVSNDGKRVALMGINAGASLLEVDNGCGQDIDVFYELWRSGVVQPANPCLEVSVYWPASEALDATAQAIVRPSFDNDGGELTIYVYPYFRKGVEYKESWVVLRASGYTSPRLDYLALGDSFSSGEGDTAVDPVSDQKYYRKLTDNNGDAAMALPREKCHISTRSYPYILARNMNLTLDDNKQWDTVACSGAVATDVFSINSSAYLGQGDTLKDYDSSSLKIQALNEMIPGRQKQVEFVKKYQPRVITLTMGGNDVGFAPKLRACLLSTKTCDYAVDSGKDVLASEISKQYDNLVSLYSELYEASGSRAKIYVLGYPQFVSNETAANCPFDVAGIRPLDATERMMVSASVTYLNSVIKSAADFVGVQYVDIENSLDGHKLCDSGDSYVTGVALVGKNELQESFHPNAKGHEAMALAAEASLGGDNMLSYDVCPGSLFNLCPDSTATEDTVSIPEFYVPADNTINANYQKMTDDNLAKGKILKLVIGSYKLMAGSLAKVTLHSTPTVLGSYIVADDGSLTAEVDLPDDVATGYHTIIIDGETYSGEPVLFEQVIYIDEPHSEDVEIVPVSGTSSGATSSGQQAKIVEPVVVDNDDDIVGTVGSSKEVSNGTPLEHSVESIAPADVALVAGSATGRLVNYLRDIVFSPFTVTVAVLAAVAKVAIVLFRRYNIVDEVEQFIEEIEPEPDFDIEE